MTQSITAREEIDAFAFNPERPTTGNLSKRAKRFMLAALREYQRGAANYNDDGIGGDFFDDMRIFGQILAPMERMEGWEIEKLIRDVQFDIDAGLKR